MLAVSRVSLIEAGLPWNWGHLLSSLSVPLSESSSLSPPRTLRWRAACSPFYSLWWHHWLAWDHCPSRRHSLSWDHVWARIVHVFSEIWEEMLTGWVLINSQRIIGDFCRTSRCQEYPQKVLFLQSLWLKAREMVQQVKMFALHIVDSGFILAPHIVIWTRISLVCPISLLGMAWKPNILTKKNNLQFRWNEGADDKWMVCCMIKNTIGGAMGGLFDFG